MQTTSRQIGPVGTTARLLVGAAMLAWAVAAGLDVTALLLGLIAMPLVTVTGLALRGRDAPPLRFDGPGGHLANILAFVALMTWQPEATLLFYGTSMLLAAWRGMGACELFAVSNALRRRDDQLGCPLFLPVDLAEARFTDRTLYCSPGAEAGSSPGP